MLLSLFGTKESNFAFRCKHCKNDELFQHESSILLNNTLIQGTKLVVNGSSSSISGIKNNAPHTSTSTSTDANACGSNKQVDNNTVTATDKTKLVVSAPSSTDKSHETTNTEIDDSLCIHVSKFKPNISYMDVADYITDKTSLEFKKSFFVYKLHQRRFNKSKPTFASFKIMAINKEIHDIIMAAELWEPEFKASPYDRTISKAKAMERRSKRTSRKLEAPQIKANTDSNHNKRKNQQKSKLEPPKFNKPLLQKTQNKQQQQKQQQQQMKHLQQQQQHHQGRKKSQQQQRPGIQLSANRHDFGQLILPNRTNFNSRNGNVVSEYGSIMPSQGTNFQPIQGKSHAPPDSMMHQLMNMLRDVQMQQRQLQQQQQQMLQLHQHRF
jgi:hypothetical protein